MDEIYLYNDEIFDYEDLLGYLNLRDCFNSISRLIGVIFSVR